MNEPLLTAAYYIDYPIRIVVSDWTCLSRPKAYQAYLGGSGFLLLYTPPAVDAIPGLSHSWRWYLKLCRVM
jgi:hypothetical protein